MLLEETRKLNPISKVLIALVAMVIFNALSLVFVDIEGITSPEFETPVHELATDLHEGNKLNSFEQLKGINEIIKSSNLGVLNQTFYQLIFGNFLSNFLLGLLLIHFLLPKGFQSIGLTNKSVILYFVTFFMASNVGVIGIQATQLNEMLGINKLQDYFFNSDVLTDAIKSITEMVIIFPNDERGYLITIIGIALIPAIGEEFLFRGVIMNSLKEKISVHNAIAISAVIFAVIHFNFTNFFYYFTLGVILGYLYYWGRSIVFPILLHFINNSTVILNYYIVEQATPELDEVLAESQNGDASVTILSYVIVAFSLGIFYMNYQRNKFLLK